MPPPLSPILNPRIILTVPAMPPASLREPQGSRGFCLSLTLKTIGDINMTRTDLLTLSPRLVRQNLAKNITLFLEREPSTESSQLDKFRVTADCSLCDRFCRIDFLSPARLSYVSVEKLAGAFYSLCRVLDEVPAPSAAPAGPKALTSVASEKKK